MLSYCLYCSHLYFLLLFCSGCKDKGDGKGEIRWGRRDNDGVIFNDVM